MENFGQYLSLSALWVEQVVVMSRKHVNQKQRRGRDFLKETILIPFFVLAFTGYLLFEINTVYQTEDVYQLHSLPPLSNKGDWGIFNMDAQENNMNDYVRSSTLYYSPNTHEGVRNLMAALTAKYPYVRALGAASPEDVLTQYQQNIFNTWASVQFNLTAEQLSTGLLVTSQTAQSVVDYTILINPNIAEALPSSTFTDGVYNSQQAQADFWWSTGLMTIENFVSTYLATQYDDVPSNFKVDTFVQRYPKSPIYPDNIPWDWTTTRWLFWKWMGSTILSICLFVPMLGLLTELVREKQFRMKDLLEISGLMNPSYWGSYMLTIILVTQVTLWWSIGLLVAFSIFNDVRIMPYSALGTSFIVGVAGFAMAFGFVIPRSEYYGLPIFLLNTGLSVGGCYVANAYDIAIGTKLFLSFLSPQIGLTVGIFSIETYLYHNGDAASVDYTAANDIKNLPSLQAITAVLCMSGLMYVLIAWGMPFDWIYRTENIAQTLSAAKVDEITYPCDNEEEELNAQANAAGSVNYSSHSGEAILGVSNLSHIYPDGTNAVKNMSFSVKRGEVLSFLGANGAGKSTCMGMLCGTLEATFGDALVNGFSITKNRTMARRNLGICMQQDIIWDDVNIEDHLLLFGRLRGLHGQKLRDDVDRMIQSLGFPEKRKSMAGTLSGGQKRRLCVGLSMVGGNSVVYLDEPTAGLDPVSRRQLWELVQRNREGRAILLTTHFMDEADVLGDRIAIVKEGRLRALGTSKFLKQRFGLGYLLRMSLNEGARVDYIKEKVNEFVPEATVVSNAGTELSLRMPKESVVQFPHLLETLEVQDKQLGVLSYGIETTTLEEVFMRIVNEDNETLLKDHAAANKLLGASPEERDLAQKKLQERDNIRNPLLDSQMEALLTKGRTPGKSENSMIFSQIVVMFVKRFHQFTRSRGQWSMGFVLPILIAIVLGLLIQSMPNQLLGPNFNPLVIVYDNTFPTPIAGPNEVLTNAYADQCLDLTSTKYVGDNYTALNDYISSIAAAGAGAASTDGVFYQESLNNFTVLYNASYPTNFAGLVTNLLNAATKNITGDRLVVNESPQQLPMNLFGQQANDGALVALLLALFAGSLGAGLSIVVGGERVSLVKHQQLASGASKMAYWIANFCFDTGLVYIQVLFLLAFMSIFVDSYGGEGFGYLAVAGIPYSIAVIFRFYAFSFFVADVKMAQTVYFYGSLFFMYVLLAIWMVLCFTSFKGNALANPVVVMGGIFTLLDPTFGYALFVLYQHNFLGVLTQKSGQNILEIGSFSLMFLAFAIILYFLCLFALDGGGDYISFNFFSRGSNVVTSNEKSDLLAGGIPDEERNITVRDDGTPVEIVHTAQPSQRVPGLLDPDVAAERVKVKKIFDTHSINPRQNAIFIHNLHKVYYARGTAPTKIAVKDVSVTIPHGEVFGLLGANGAGKTTLLKMVSGQEDPTSGRALINGFDVVGNRSNAQRSMGLCPQFDTLIERLTVKENLLFFGQIKGLSGDNLVNACEAFMSAMSIKKYENKLIQQLSGGNRRKVSLAVALLGAPPTVYLDEPSTGLDPVASRLMWRLLSKISATRQSAIVLTTHNMLECEAVCTRICIMKMGEMVCLGDSQHLRSAHGTGFLLELNVNSPQSMVTAKQFVAANFSHADVVDEHSTMINYEIPRTSISRLSAAFKLLEENKLGLGIVDYALSQSTLEQVFLKQIRPNAQHEDGMQETGLHSPATRIATTRDFAIGYFMWLLAGIVPGLHHFYLGNTWRGVKYFCTWNEVFAGWLLDLFELHVLIQKSVEEYGHTTGPCCCGPKRTVHVDIEERLPQASRTTL